MNTTFKKVWDNYGLGALLLLLVVAYAANMFLNYLNNKGSFGFEANSSMQDQHKNAEASASVKPSNPDGNEEYATVSGITTTQPPDSGNCNANQNPSELLPHDSNSQWSELNPSGKGELSNINLLQAGHHIGTVSQSLRNANLQIRSEPANPQMSVGPWNNTTMEPETHRQGLEMH
jgi:hypothetical protein